MNTSKTITERKDDILFLMKYAVPEGQVDAAETLLEKYDSDIIALNLLYSFYINLPEGKDDSVKALRLLTRQQGVFLLCVSTGNDLHYLYLVNNEKAYIIGTVVEGITDQQLLDFLGYANNEEVLSLTKKPEMLKVYEPYVSDSNLCPSCQIGEG